MSSVYRGTVDGSEIWPLLYVEVAFVEIPLFNPYLDGSFKCYTSNFGGCFFGFLHHQQDENSLPNSVFFFPGTMWHKP